MEANFTSMHKTISAGGSGSRRVAFRAVAMLMVALAAIVPAAGCSELRGAHYHAGIYMSQLKISSGYARVSAGDATGGSCGCDLIRSFVGPAGVDPQNVFSGPKFQFTAVNRTLSFDTWILLGSGSGYSSQAGTCDVVVSRFDRTASVSKNQYQLGLSADQVRDWNSGVLDVLQVDIVCARDGAM